jgi:hypothetical protein
MGLLLGGAISIDSPVSRRGRSKRGIAGNSVAVHDGGVCISRIRRESGSRNNGDWLPAASPIFP